MDEVSDPDEWCNLHHGPAHSEGAHHGEDETVGDAVSPRSRSRGSDHGNPGPKAMPKPLAKQVARRVALDTALEMAETISNSGGGTSSSTGKHSIS